MNADSRIQMMYELKDYDLYECEYLLVQKIKDKNDAQNLFKPSKCIHEILSTSLQESIFAKGKRPGERKPHGLIQ